TLITGERPAFTLGTQGALLGRKRAGLCEVAPSLVSEWRRRFDMNFVAAITRPRDTDDSERPDWKIGGASGVHWPSIEEWDRQMKEAKGPQSWRERSKHRKTMKLIRKTRRAARRFAIFMNIRPPWKRSNPRGDIPQVAGKGPPLARLPDSSRKGSQPLMVPRWYNSDKFRKTMKKVRSVSTLGAFKSSQSLGIAEGGSHKDSAASIHSAAAADASPGTLRGGDEETVSGDPGGVSLTYDTEEDHSPGPGETSGSGWEGLSDSSPEPRGRRRGADTGDATDGSARDEENGEDEGGFTDEPLHEVLRAVEMTLQHSSKELAAEMGVSHGDPRDFEVTLPGYMEPFVANMEQYSSLPGLRIVRSGRGARSETALAGSYTSHASDLTGSDALTASAAEGEAAAPGARQPGGLSAGHLHMLQSIPGPQPKSPAPMRVINSHDRPWPAVKNAPFLEGASTSKSRFQRRSSASRSRSPRSRSPTPHMHQTSPESNLPAPPQQSLSGRDVGAEEGTSEARAEAARSSTEPAANACSDERAPDAALSGAPEAEALSKQAREGDSLTVRQAAAKSGKSTENVT
ncbi:hypothetical protein CYMTET_35302, partial [Cymbomonas tetramitiformis]